MFTDLQNGLCNSHNDPDLWFSTDVVDLAKSKSGPSPIEFKQENIKRTIQALKICDRCPVKDMCLEEGLKKDNLEFGVWGGSLPGERLQMTFTPINTSFRQTIVGFAKQVRREQLGVK